MVFLFFLSETVWLYYCPDNAEWNPQHVCRRADISRDRKRDWGQDERNQRGHQIDPFGPLTDSIIGRWTKDVFYLLLLIQPGRERADRDGINAAASGWLVSALNI